MARIILSFFSDYLAFTPYDYSGFPLLYRKPANLHGREQGLVREGGNEGEDKEIKIGQEDKKSGRQSKEKNMNTHEREHVREGKKDTVVSPENGRKHKAKEKLWRKSKISSKKAESHKKKKRIRNNKDERRGKRERTRKRHERNAGDQNSGSGREDINSRSRRTYYIF